MDAASEPTMNTRTFTLAALAAFTTLVPVTATAADGWYGGVQFGNASTSEDFASAPLPTAAPVPYSVCGGTATLTPVGFPQVTSLEASASAYQFFVGRRFGSWGFELGSFNVARFEDKATAPATATQPVCNPASNLVIEGEQVGLVSYAFEGFAFTPVYSIPFGEGEKWMIDVRATIAFWDGEERSQYQMVATERNTAGDFLQQYSVAIVNDDGASHGVDVGVGLGLSYQLKEKVRVRGIYEQQAFGDFP
jgi:hypothetical protein